MSDPIDITDLSAALCKRRLGFEPSYCYRLEIDASSAETTVYLYKGDHGRCEGNKFVRLTDGKPATETVTVKTRV